MAAIESIVKEVRDITECPICTEMFCTPKMLPCFHMFCLKCMEQYCKDKEEGDTMPCPMCRKEFIVPTGGMSKLNTNFFIERLIAVQSASIMNQVVNCDVCQTGKRCKVEASSFCLECQENMCGPCSHIHKSMKMTMSHHLSTVGDLSTMEAIKIKIRRKFCDKHPTEEIKFFCRNCKIPFCTTCFIAKHNKHECCEIGEIVEEFKRSFRQHSDDVSKLLPNIKKQSDEVDKQLASFSIGIDTAEKNILERSEAIKRMVDKHTQALIAKLNSHKTQCVKNIQTTKEELLKNMMMCENFVGYCQKAIEEADAVESFRIDDELKTRAEELKARSFIDINKLPNIQFHPSNLDTTIQRKNIVGNIRVKHSFELSPQGFASLKDELFCVFSNSLCINVYNFESFAFRRTITVDGMNCPYDIVASQNNLYVSDTNDKLIHRIQLPEVKISKWIACGAGSNLSTTQKGNVIVLNWHPSKIIEYTPDGTLVREIASDQIDKNLICLQHVIQLEGDKFLVCHATDELSRVCIIKNTGYVIECYEGLSLAEHMAIGRNGSIFVADSEKNRIVQLSASLKELNEFAWLKDPIKLHLSDELGRLYVIEMNDRSITILDI